ncbi:MAG: thiamine pyrophosphate-dependent enzyme, partial [Nitrospinota bacterium]|nr:thiamine pyrophosphate-dependent enzyme [Nitrospinota bacterium]
DGKIKEFHQFIGMELNPPEIDFVKLAEGMGVAGRRAERGKDLEAAIREALQAGKPCLIEAAIRNEEI